MNEPLCAVCNAPTEIVTSAIPVVLGDPASPRREWRRCTQPANHEGAEYYRDDRGHLQVHWPS